MHITNVTQAQAHITLLQAFIAIKTNEDGAEEIIAKAFRDSGENTCMEAREIEIVNVVLDTVTGTITVFARFEDMESDEDTKVGACLFLMMNDDELHGEY